MDFGTYLSCIDRYRSSLIAGKPMPSDETQTRGKNAMEGDHITLLCSFAGRPAPLEAVWMKDGKPFNDSHKHATFSQAAGRCGGSRTLADL